MPAEPLIPAPAAHWARLIPTDAPVLRNTLWQALRNFDRGTWTVAVYAGATRRLDVVAAQLYVVDNFGSLVPIEGDALERNDDFYLSTFAIDQAACDLWDVLSTPLDKAWLTWAAQQWQLAQAGTLQ